MKYPTIQQIEEADQVQLCRWMRFLASPGNEYVGLTNKEQLANEDAILMQTRLEQELLRRIDERHKEGGGFTPEISKLIGWEESKPVESW